jgi:quercetin 2,3-dioxygenase
MHLSEILNCQTEFYQKIKTFKMTLKKVLNKSQLQFHQAFDGMKAINMFARDYLIEPFLAFTEYHMNNQVFGPHPHAGISVMTYILPDSIESFINRDSNGNFNIIEPGGLHVTQAGSGIHHDEFPKNKGNDAHGLQIWINHSNANRMVEPKAIPVKASEVKEFITEDYKVRLIHGKFEGQKSNYQMVTDVTLLHIYVNPEKSIVLNAEEMAFVYVLNGIGKIENTEIEAHNMITFETIGDQIEIKAGETGLQLMFGTGMPLKEQITYGGSFVMTTPEQMFETQQKARNGQMGHLERYNY